MQKNPCRVDDPLQNPIDRETYEDAVSLEDGIYPITTDDNTIISSDMVKHGNGTVEQALDELSSSPTYIGMFSNGDTISIDFSKYSVLYFVPVIHVTNAYTPFVSPVQSFAFNTHLYINIYQDGSYHVRGYFTRTSTSMTFTQVELTGWTDFKVAVYAR